MSLLFDDICYTIHMLSTTPNTIEDYIYRYLQNGPIQTAVLVEKIKNVRASTTKQGVYAALRNLKKQEIAILHNKHALLNIRWLINMEQYFAIAQKSYFEGTLGNGNF